MRRLFSLLTAAVVVLTACEEPTAPVPEDVKRQDFLSLWTPLISISVGRTEAHLTFARLAAGVEPEVQQASFWAVRGQARTLRIHYRNGYPTNVPLLEFHVGANSLLAYPDGQRMAVGDSVEITVTVDPDRQYIFRFEPYGLQFSAREPALLRMNSEGADPDVNGDGVVNIWDQVSRNQFKIWRQDMLGLPWLLVPTLRIPWLDTMEGRVTHFTGFAMAS